MNPARAGLVLALMAAATLSRGARAQGGEAAGPELWQSAMPDAGAWISEAGRGAWMLTRGFGVGFPLAQAGLARGGWQVVDPTRAPEGRPFPGMIGVLPPLSGLDSLVVEPLRAGEGGGAARGLSALRAVPDPRLARGRPRARFGILSGDFNVDETSLTAERGSDNGAIHLEALAAGRGILAPYGEAGRHRWSAGLIRRFGMHEISGTFRQSGFAARLLTGEDQTARGASGRAAWTWARASWRSEFAVSRQWDSQESFGGTLVPRSRRDAQDVRLEGALRRAWGANVLGLRADWSRARIARLGPGAFGENHEDTWLAATLERFDPARRILVEVGGARIGATDELVFVPAARLERDYGAHRLEVWAGRQLEPVWGDVVDRAFLQNTWTAGAGLARRGRALTGALRATAGRTRDRAVIRRLPLPEQWLRAGIARDPETWQFVQLWGETRWTGGRWSLGAESCGLVREAAIQSRVDPDVTGRAFGEVRFSAFHSDLQVGLRLEGEGVGDRQTDEVAPRELAAFASMNAGATIAIGDAQVAVRVLNLENRRRPDVWIDAATGEPALGPGRALRFAVAWGFTN